MYPAPIAQLINAFSVLPGVGPRTAERFVFALLKKGKKEVGELTLALQELLKNIKSCSICQNFTDRDPCAICSDRARDQSIICVVAEPQDMVAIEKIGSYKGRYHILRGLIDTFDETSLTTIKIPELRERIRTASPKIQEIILALDPTMQGETTMLYLQKELQPFEIKITRLARGLPMGSDLQYADEITLESALKGRSEMK